MSAYTGNIIRIDLSTGDIKIETLSEKIYRKYQGGSALACYFLLKELKPGVNPLGEDNVLVFSCSALTGAPIPGASRFTVAAKSPLTGGLGRSEAGGWWAPELKKAGFDVIIIKGRAKNPVYIWIHDGKVVLKNATHLQRKTTGEKEKIIRKELGNDKICIAQNGPAGENLVRYSCILNNSKHANGRTGMGAVMGSKNLYGIAVFGTKKLIFKDKSKLLEINKWFSNKWKDAPTFNLGLNLYGTAQSVYPLSVSGILPTRNFREGEFEDTDKISGEMMEKSILISREGCYACPIKCKRVVESNEEYNIDPYYGGPEYETVAALGSLCAINNLKAIAKGNELCNKYGLDTISTGATIAFAMECYENGIISDRDTGGIKLKFGNAGAMVKMIEMICKREGIGDLLAEGVARAAEKIGNGAEKFALHVKKQELPMHDPRGKTGVGLQYALSPKGADHMEAPHDPSYSSETGALKNAAILGILEPVNSLDLSSKKVRLYAYLKKVYDLYDTIGICDFVGGPDGALTLDKIVEATKAVTGWNTSLWELLKVAERANTMARCFNTREGFNKEDDTLPDRLFEPLENGVLKGEYIDKKKFNEAINMYYSMEGWSKEGVPKRARLVELGLDWISP